MVKENIISISIILGLFMIWFDFLRMRIGLLAVCIAFILFYLSNQSLEVIRRSQHHYILSSGSAFPQNNPYTFIKYDLLKDFTREFVHMKEHCLQTRIYPWGQLAGREQCV